MRSGRLLTIFLAWLMLAVLGCRGHSELDWFKTSQWVPRFSLPADFVLVLGSRGTFPENSVREELPDLTILSDGTVYKLNYLEEKSLYRLDTGRLPPGLLTDVRAEVDKLIHLDAPNRDATYWASDASIWSIFLKNGKESRLFQIYAVGGPVDERQAQLSPLNLAAKKWLSMRIPDLHPYRARAVKVFFRKPRRDERPKATNCPKILETAMKSIRLTKEEEIATVIVEGTVAVELQRLLYEKTDYSRSLHWHFAFRLQDRVCQVAYRPLMPWENRSHPSPLPPEQSKPQQTM